MPLSEFDLIEKYFKNLTKDNDLVVTGIGDDAAVINIPPGRQLVTSVDTLVSGIHFFPDTSPDDIGYKSLAVNISDLAAMGARPCWVTLSLTLPENNPDWIEKFAHGFSVPAQKYGVSLIGGDLTHGPLSITVTIMGLVEKNRAITRGGTATGDIVYVSGCLGGAGLALHSLLGKLTPDMQPSQSSIDRLLRPEPRVDLGYALINLASAAIDISDGLAADLGHILEQSGKGAMVDLERVPLCNDLQQIKDRDQRYQLALSAGDDYELCFTVPANRQADVAALCTGLNLPLQRIGVITEGNAIIWRWSDGSEFLLKDSGYRHF